MAERKIIEVLAAEIEPAAATADDSANATLVPIRGSERLAPIARRISTEALAAELAAERGDWETVHATYERLAVLFAEYRLLYLQCLTTGDDSEARRSFGVPAPPVSSAG
jgi:hypothetical protein